MPTCRVCGRDAEKAEILPGLNPQVVDPIMEDQWWCSGCHKFTKDCTCATAW